MGIVISRKRHRKEILDALTTVTPSTPELKEKTIKISGSTKETVSQLMHIKKQGYIMVGTFTEDNIVGLVFEYALGEDKEQVIDKHVDYMVALKIRDAKRGNLRYKVVS